LLFPQSDLGKQIIDSATSREHALSHSHHHNTIINLAKEEKEKEISKGAVFRITHDIYDYADETVAHAEGVSRDELVLESYHKLGSLLAQWAKKLDKIERVNRRPKWLDEYIEAEGASERPLVDLGPESLGFEIDNLFFAREKKGDQLTDDLMMVSQPRSMWMEDFKELVRFCDKLGLDFYVDGFNTTLPGRTFRVVIYKPVSGPHKRLQIRESSLFAMQIFDAARKENGLPTKLQFVDALVATGKFDKRDLAENAADFLIKNRLIPNLI
jgi:hypothetical protein